MKKFLLISKHITLAFLLIISATFAKATNYFTTAAGSVNTLANWWTNTNGTGSNPANFTTAGDVFIIQTGDAMTQAAAWTVTGTVQIDAGGSLTKGGFNITCGAFILNGTATFPNSAGTSTTVNGNVSGNGTIVAGGTNRQFNVTGNWTFNGTMTVGDDIQLTLNGTGNQTLSGTLSNGTDGSDLTINKTSGVVTLASAINLGSTGGTFINTAGTFDPATFLLTAPSISVNGGTVRVNGATVGVNYSSAITEAAAGTIEYSGAGAQTVNDVSYPGSLTLAGGNTKSWALGAARTIGGALNVNAGSTLTLSNNQTLGVTGATTIDGTINLGGTSAKTFTGNVDLNAGAVWNETGVAAYNFGGNLTNDATTFTANTGTHTFTGTTKVHSGGTVTSIPNFTVTGTLSNSGTITVPTAIIAGGGTLTNAATGTLNIGGTIAATPTLTATAVGNTVNYTGGAQTARVTTYSNLTLSGSGAKTFATTPTVNTKLSIQGTASVVVTGAPVVTYGAGAILEYAGGAAQTTTTEELPAAGVVSLTVNNAAGVTLVTGTNPSISGTLTLTAGNLTIPTGVTLTLTVANAIGGTGKVVTSFNVGTGAQGFIRVNAIPANSSYTFPLNDGTYDLPLTLTQNAATVQAQNSFTVAAFNGITTNGQPNGTPFTLAQKTKVVDAVWTINYNGAGSPTQGPVGAFTTIFVSWPLSLEGSIFTDILQTPNGLIGIAHYGPAAWGTAVGLGDNGANTATRTGNSQFSPFAVGRIDAGGAPLAIQIGYFNASKGNTVNTLNWSAACNSAQATFEIERSADGRNFTTINSITASQARCALPFTYDDASPLAGVNFYRIKIIDVDGRVGYTSTVKIGAQQKDMVLVGVLPNPVSNIAQLNITTSKKDKVELAVVSLEGKVVYNTTVSLQSGSSIVSIDATNFAKGAYIIRGVFADGQASSVKFIKQ